MLVQMPQQATRSRQELGLVPPAWRRQSLGVLCRRHTMLVQRLQQAVGILASISPVLCHLHRNLVCQLERPVPQGRQACAGDVWAACPMQNHASCHLPNKLQSCHGDASLCRFLCRRLAWFRCVASCNLD